MRFAFILLILNRVAHLDFKIFQMDVAAFLNEELEEKIYMDQPNGFELRDKAQSMLAKVFHLWP